MFKLFFKEYSLTNTLHDEQQRRKTFVKARFHYTAVVWLSAGFPQAIYMARLPMSWIKHLSGQKCPCGNRTESRKTDVVETGL
jgi:hypothetical protein